MPRFHPRPILVLLAYLSGSMAAGQTPCSPWKVQVFPADLSLAQRACIGVSELASPGVFLGSALVSGVSQWRNNPQMRTRDTDDIAVRFAHLYERRTARITGEVLMGYWHHEDLRLHRSGEQGVWSRTRFALLSVLESPGANGDTRVALAPLVGSLGSGLTSMALYQRQNSLGWGLERSGLAYSHYFVRALFHEFSPDLWNLAPRFVRNKLHNQALPTD